VGILCNPLWNINKDPPWKICARRGK
jgi:hypothetical protein